jgi:large subunit ribosomal protein L24e
MPTCSFCKIHYEFPRGLTIFLNDGRTLFFCSSKCRRNHGLGRDPRKINWVRKSKTISGIDAREKIAKKKEEAQKTAIVTESKSEKK